MSAPLSFVKINAPEELKRLYAAEIEDKQPDPEWRTRIVTIQEARTAADDSTSERHNGFKVLRRGPKRSKASVLPDVHTYYATEVPTPHSYDGFGY
ncbi:hypothetical protein SLS59_002219 [Nothophoma quercina]|uniref:Uncharacterized protein n=1 Tax=Nothophoma quercina TaxID=749835 RepID=A0ABR3RS42_9PLEO